jgi:hypothetical protein
MSKLRNELEFEDLDSLVHLFYSTTHGYVLCRPLKFAIPAFVAVVWV